MNPYVSLDYGTNPFWDRLIGRIKPFLGDVEQTLGRYWMDAFETCFARSDFLAVETAQATRGKVPRWYVLEFSEGTLQIDDWVLAGETAEQCIAHLHERCDAEHLWPTRIEYGRDSGKTTFYDDRGEILAIVRPLPEARPIAASLRTRSESTLLGLRKAPYAGQEFVRRLAKWPGMNAQAWSVNKSNYERRIATECNAHWPCPSEWLLSARILLQAAGRGKPSTAEAQSFAAAALGLPSWNHLCGLLPPQASVGDWCSLAGPYNLDSESAQVIVREPIEAFLDSVPLARAKVGTHSVHMNTSFIGLPTYFLSKEQGPEDKMIEWPIASVTPVDQVAYEPATLVKVAAAVNFEGENGGDPARDMEALFCVS
jgi:hypothetical protein